MKINTRLLLTLILVALIPLAVISTIFYLNAREALSGEVLSHLQSVAAIQRHRVESIVEQNLGRLTLVSSRTQLRLSLDSFIRNPNVEDQDKMNKILLDALTTVRPYKEPLPVEKSLETIKQSQGSHFDPYVVDAFLAVRDEILSIIDRYRDEQESQLMRMVVGIQYANR